MIHSNITGSYLDPFNIKKNKTSETLPRDHAKFKTNNIEVWLLHIVLGVVRRCDSLAVDLPTEYTEYLKKV